MSWAEIKHAINSSLGTDDFKPLNELINGTKGLVASDNLYMNLVTSNISVSSRDTYTIPINVNINWNGSFRLSGVFYTNTNYRGKLEVYKNNVLVDTITATADSTTKISADFMCNKGDIFTLTINNTNISVMTNLRNLAIYADLVDTSGITLISN